MPVRNFIEDTKEIKTVTRYNGGWLKKVDGIDKSQKGGYSILGDFVNAGGYKENYQEGLYIDCSKGGSRKNHILNYHLFRLTEEKGFKLLKTIKDGGRHWAVSFWEDIEKELNTHNEIDSQTIVNSIYEKTTDTKIIKEVIQKLEDKIKVENDINNQ